MKHSGVISEKWWSVLDKKRAEMRLADSQPGDHPTDNDPDVSSERFDQKRTLDDLIQELQSIKYKRYDGDGTVPVAIAYRDDSDQISMGAVLVDCNDADSQVILSADRQNTVIDGLASNDDSRYDDDDESMTDRVMRVAKAIHSDDIGTINHARAAYDESVYTAAKIADGLVESTLEDYPDTDEGWDAAVASAIQINGDQ
jgi:hypothetical protein